MKLLLSKRQKSIVLNLQQSKRQAAKTEQRFLAAQLKFKKASEKALEIRRQANESIKQQRKEYQMKLSRELQQLEELKESTINSQRRKIQKEIAQKTIDLIFQKVEKRCHEEFDQNIRKAISLWSIKQFKEKF